MFEVVSMLDMAPIIGHFWNIQVPRRKRQQKLITIIQQNM